ncbi:neurofilament medium polypeptide [Battus philenor]|uniref:neurofilament medium polypeptide n=1 Tax=Battus philenor TaxID=42288 RepID=UPI0035D06EE4
MGKDDKEDSGFGFKDKAKAEETLRLLEEHDPNYRRLTVRGLLGRAKRVLSMTKSEEKIKNIKEAMEVFENWLADLEKNKEKKTDKKESKKEEKEKKDDEKESSPDVEMEDRSKREEKKELPPDTVPGLGFKDKAAAESTLKELEGRDPDYQKLAVKGLIGRAKRVLTCTKDETKISNIKEAMSLFDKFLDDFDTMHLSKQNNPYISLGIVNTCLNLTDDDLPTDHQKSFIEAYRSVNGEYKRLRTVVEKKGGKTWDIVRNTALKELKEKFADTKLFNEKDEPTKEHLQMLLWAYSPEPARVKKTIQETKADSEGDSKSSESDGNSRKRRSSARDEESPSKKKKE